jgi:CRP/FNR family transcriptional regulator, cyclic AMP receptor protein
MGEAEFKALARIAGRLEFFSPLKGEELDRLLSHIQLYGYGKGESIFKPGDSAEAIFIIYEGQIKIPMNKHLLWLIRKQARLGPGDVFGEMAILENRPRKLKAVATQPTKLFVLLRPDFDALMNRNPVFAEGIRFIASRRRFEDSR